MTILSALKKLHKKMTGQETISKTIGGVLDSIQENYSGGGGGSTSADLPEPGTSGNVLTSDGTAWASAAPQTVTVDANPTEDSENAVSSGGVYTALGGKQATLTFDNSPTENSDNPVKSSGIYTALAGKADKVESPLKLTGEVGEDNDQNPTLIITDDYTMQELYTEVNSGRLVYVDFELGEGMKLRAQSIGCYYVPADSANEAQYSVTFNVTVAEGEQGSVMVRFYSASFTNSNTALIIVKTITAS